MSRRGGGLVESLVVRVFETLYRPGFFFHQPRYHVPSSAKPFYGPPSRTKVSLTLPHPSTRNSTGLHATTLHPWSHSLGTRPHPVSSARPPLAYIPSWRRIMGPGNSSCILTLQLGLMGCSFLSPCPATTSRSKPIASSAIRISPGGTASKSGRRRPTRTLPMSYAVCGNLWSVLNCSVPS